MIQLYLNNFGGGVATFKDYQSNNICVLNGKISIDPTNQSYIEAKRLELILPADFIMKNSAISSAILVSTSTPLYHGTVLRCWIENYKICIEKFSYFDSLGNYDIYINSAFVTRGYRGSFINTINKPLSIINDDLFEFDRTIHIETNNYTYFAESFLRFPYSKYNGYGPFTLQLSGIATDFSIEIPLFIHSANNLTTEKGSRIVIGTFENGNLTFSYPEGYNNIGGSYCFILFYAVRDNTSPT